MIGDLTSTSVAGMLRLFMAYRRSGAFSVGQSGQAGILHLQEGRIIATNEGVKQLEAATLRCLAITEGQFHFDEKSAPPKQTAAEPLEGIEHLIILHSRSVSIEYLTPYLPKREIVLQPAPRNESSGLLRLLLLSEEWNILTMLHGEHSLSDLLQAHIAPEPRVLQAVYGFLTAGLIKKCRFKINEILAMAGIELGVTGEAVVAQALRNLHLDRNRMRMKDLLALLNEIEKNISILIGPTRGARLIEMMWHAAKR
jgi:hypothetical protein